MGTTRSHRRKRRRRRRRLYAIRIGKSPAEVEAANGKRSDARGSRSMPRELQKTPPEALERRRAGVASGFSPRYSYALEIDKYVFVRGWCGIFDFSLFLNLNGGSDVCTQRECL